MSFSTRLGLFGKRLFKFLKYLFFSILLKVYCVCHLLGNIGAVGAVRFIFHTAHLLLLGRLPASTPNFSGLRKCRK